MFDHIAPAFLEEIVAFLLPLFLTGARGDTGLARQAALSALAACDVTTEQELRLAAEITSLGFGVLESLAKSMNPDLPINAVLRLRGNANALHRSAYQNQRVLDRLRQQRKAAEQPTPIETAPTGDAPIVDASTIVLTQQATPAPTFHSRQERRAAERKAAKQTRQQAERERLAQRRLATKAASQHPPRSQSAA